jgi:hypothetical protein
MTSPLNGRLGALAFRDRQLVALRVLETIGDLISDIHAIADPAKLAIAGLPLRDVTFSAAVSSLE